MNALIDVNEAQFGQLQELQKAATAAVMQNNTQFLIGGIVVFGLLVSPIGLPAAACVAAPLVVIAIKRAITNGAAAAYMKESGNFAPLLNDRQLLKLTKLVGQQTVLEQLQEALENGKWLSGSALDYLEICGINTDPPDLKVELAKLAKQQAEQAAAIDVQASTVQEPQAASLLDDESLPAATGDAGVAAQPLIEAIALDPKSLFLSAPVRTGKGVVIAGAIRATQRLVANGKHPSIKSIKFWAMTPKQFAGEHWYWQTVDQFHNPDLDAPGKIATCRSIYQFITAFTALERDRENPTVLIIDEFSRLLGLVAGIKMWDVDPVLFKGDAQGFDRWLVDKVMLSASMSQANGLYAWVILPANTVGGRGFSKGDADSFNVFTLASPLNLAFADGGGAAFAAPVIEADHPVFKQAFAAGYRKRDRKWYPIPDFGDIINRRTDIEPPVELTNRWLAPLPQETVEQTATLLSDELPTPPATPAAEKPLPESKPLSDYFELFRYRPLLIWGPQGSGKSTVAREIVRQKRLDGQTVSVLNPHGSSVEWDGADVVGAGKDYQAINDYLKGYLVENKGRYEDFRDSELTEQQYQALLLSKNSVISPICEEMSSWYHNLPKGLLGAFSLCCLTESRKVMMPPVFVAHDRTLDFIGLKRGANLKEDGLVELELLAPETDATTGQLISSGRGILRIPGGQSFPVHFDNFDVASTKRTIEDQPAPQGGLTTAASQQAEDPEQTEPADENGLMIVEYLAIQTECSTCSAVLDRLGTKLERRGLIERRTVDCLKQWLTENNLPLPGVSATPSEPETEPEPETIAPTPPQRPQRRATSP